MRTRVEAKTNEEIKASGIIPNLSQALEDIIEQIKE